jgi:hypothetical protein
MFQLRISTLMWRFYLMMAVGIIAVYTAQSWLIVVTFAIAVSAILGYRIPWPRTEEKEGKHVALPPQAGKKLRQAS